MTTAHHDQVLALAGVFQSAQLVQQLAREGRTDPAAFRASVESILKIDAPDAASVFGGKDGVRRGLELISTKLLGHSAPSDMEMARYVVAMLHIEKVLRSKPELLDTLGDGIKTAMEQMKFFEASSGESEDGLRPQLVEKLADLYSRTISTLTPRIMVSGEHGHLNNPAIAARVRSALLAGIRAAVLWRQLGGRRWQLLFSRSRIVRNAQELLAA